MNDSKVDGFGHIEEHNMNEEREPQRIRQLNDTFRQTGDGGRQLITSGIQDMGLLAMLAIRQMVAGYDEFCEDNDPYGEHDFGALTFQGQKIFWKIDYYDSSMTAGSPDPTDPSVTTRVLTIMLASEY